jgi:methylated-DNA-[protein]-cysteine S-methyltransferase
VTLRLREIDTLVGRLVAAIDDAGAVRRITFARDAPLAAVTQMIARAEEEPVEWDPPAGEDLARQLGEYFVERRRAFDLVLDAHGALHDRRVWKALSEIPYGETVTYGELAERLGEPGAARAVGRSAALNPLPIVVPCHRLVGAQGTLTGYAGGLDAKRTLLALEGVIPRSLF